MAFNDNISRFKRIDNLIRMQATGCPKTLAEKLGISKRMLHNDISTMKAFGSPIAYNNIRQTYYYTIKGKVYFGFYTEELTDNELKNISAGFILKKNESFFTQCNNIAL